MQNTRWRLVKVAFLLLILFLQISSQGVKLIDYSAAKANVIQAKPESAQTRFIPKTFQFIIPPTQKQIHQYQGSITIDLDNDNATVPSVIVFYVNFVEDDEKCSYKQCYIGWVDKYITDGEQGRAEIAGYPNVNGPQPVFKFQTNSGDDFNLVYSNSLQDVWKQIIDIACEKFNPFDAPPKSGARLLAADISAYATKEQTIRSSDLSFQKAILSQQIQLDPENKFIAKRAQRFQLKLQTDQDGQEVSSDAKKEDPLPELQGNIDISLNLIARTKDSKKIIDGVKQALNSKAVKLSTFTKSNIENLRKSGSISIQDINDDDLFKEIDIEPKFQIQGDRPFDKQIIENTNINAQFWKTTPSIQLRKNISPEEEGIEQPEHDENDFNPSTYQNVNYGDEFTQKIFGDTLKIPTYQDTTIGNEFSQKILGDSLKIPTYKLDLNLGTRNRFLQTSSQIILNYVKSLYQKTILGKTVELKIQVQCYLITSNSSTNVQCTGKLLYNIFGNSKTLTVFSFTRPVNSIWSWSNSYNGSWNFNFAIPLPPPVSFITIHFHVKITYWIKISLYSQQLSTVPFRFSVGAFVETGLSTDSRASVRIIAIQGGVYIKGTLVKVGTNPSLTFTFLFPQKKIQILISWYFWIIAFQFEWGFFWRYWRLFKGWSSIKIIKKWTVNGIYQKYTIIYKYLYLSYP